MTTYSYTVLSEEDIFDFTTSSYVPVISYETMTIVAPDGVTAFELNNIPNDPLDDYDFPDVGSVELDLDAYNVQIGDKTIDFENTELNAVRVSWMDDGVTFTTDILSGDMYTGGRDYHFIIVLDGQPFPEFESAAEFEAFSENNVIGLAPITSGPFQSGQAIPLSAADAFTGSSEDDQIQNVSGFTEVFGGLGDDEFQMYSDQSAYGGTGEDEFYADFGESGLAFYGGAGDDDFVAYHNDNSFMDGGDGWDFVYVKDVSSDLVVVNYNEGQEGVYAYNYGSDDAVYETYFANMENIGVEVAFNANLVIFGGDGDDRIRLYEQGPSFIFYDGGEGVDRLELNRIENDDTGEPGLTLAELLEYNALYLQDDGSVAIFDYSTDLFFGELINVEQIRLNGEDGGEDVVVNIADIAVEMPDFESGSVSGTNGDDFLLGGNGDDVMNGGFGNDVIEGGYGSDDIRGGLGFDEIFGGANNDTLTGAGGFDTLHGDTGNDLIKGNSGNDLMFGGYGDDEMIGGQGSDELYGDEGNDVMTGQGGDDAMFGGDGNDTLNGNASGDLLVGGGGKDTLNGGQGFDELYGGNGDDHLNGGSGFDILFGNEGNDVLNGNSGNDVLNGGNGDDILRGGQGADTFEFNSEFGHNTILDFSNNIDEIVFSVDIAADFAAIKAASSVVDGNLVLTFAADHTLTLNNITNVNALEDDVFFSI